MVPFRPHEMTYRTKATFLPDRHESVNVRPAIKGGAEGIRLEDPVRLVEHGLKPIIAGVSLASPAVSRPIIDKVGRVRHNKIDGITWKHGQKRNGIGMDYLVDERINRIQNRNSFLLRVGRR